MTGPVEQTDWRKWAIGAAALIIAVTLVATAYVARAILIPIALAILIAFVLSPVVKWMEKRGLGRLPAVLATVGSAVLVFGMVAWAVSWQMSTLTNELPNYTQKIKERVRTVRVEVIGTGQGRFGTMIKEISMEVDPDKQEERERREKEAEREKGMAGGFGSPEGKRIESVEGESPSQVTVKPPGSSGLNWIEQLISPAMELIGQAAFAFILAVFMLVKREDLRNRLIRLVGQDHRITATTRAVDDASRRVSRFLFMQLLLNTGFGVVITITMLSIGANYALLWGFFASVMRYVPYIGTWIGLIPPVVTSLAMSEGWWQPITIIAVYGGLELFSNNVIEPRLYGANTGISEVALLVATAFWALIWGPIGLVLAAPLTVCLLVLGKYVPQLHFLEVLLGDEPVLPPNVRLYQRLAARDQDEASLIVEEAVKSTSLESAFDDVVVPSLTMIAEGQQTGALAPAEAEFAYEALVEIVAELSETYVEPVEVREDEAPIRILTVPAHNEADEVVLRMTVGLLDPRQWSVKVLGHEKLSAEVVAEAGLGSPHVILIGSVPPGGWARARYLTKRLRAQCPDAHIVVSASGADKGAEQIATITAAGSNQVTTTVTATAKHLRSWRAISGVQEQEAKSDSQSPAEELVGVGTPSAQ